MIADIAHTLSDIRRRRDRLGWNYHRLEREAGITHNALRAMDAPGWNPTARVLGLCLSALDRGERAKVEAAE